MKCYAVLFFPSLFAILSFISTLFSHVRTLFKRGAPKTTSFWSVLFVVIMALFGGIISVGARGIISGYEEGNNWGFGGPVQKPEMVAASTGEKSSSEGTGSSNDERHTLIAGDTAVVASSDPLSDLLPVSGGLKRYKVKRGDTLQGIADRFHVSRETLLWANPGASSVLTTGQTLLVPPVSGVVYQVKPGDTLKEVGGTYGVDLELIKKYNADYQNVLSEGGVLILPYARPLASSGRGTTSADADLPNLKNYFALPAIGWNWGQLHNYNAVDIANQCGTPVHAAAEGLVVIDENFGSGAEGWNDGYGIFVLVEHPNGTKTRYAHLAKALVKPGDYVNRGEELGLMGNTGNTHGPTGCHLHFEVYGAKNPFAVTK